MPTDQYHEPPTELSDDTRTFARVIASLQEEAEAIGWYEQRRKLRKPSSPETLPNSSPGVKSIRSGVGVVDLSG